MVVVDGEDFVLDCLGFGAFGKLRGGSVEGEGKKVVAGVCGVDNLKAELFGKCLVGKPGFLFFGAEHADAGLSLCFGVGYAVFHQ